MDVELYGPERASRNAHPAADAQAVIDQNPVQGLVPNDGVFGADGQTGRVRTLHAQNRKEERLSALVPEDLDPGEVRSGFSCFFQRTGPFAISATVAVNRLD